MKAITYYYSLFSQSSFSGIKLHETGEEAVKTIKQDAKAIFALPYISKDDMELKQGKAVAIGFGHRHLVARFLSENELALYEKYGDECHFDFSKQELCEPPRTKKD